MDFIHVEQRLTRDIKPYQRNARTHSDEQVEQIVASMREFGFTNPILCGEDLTVIAGHGRLLAAKKLGMEFVPVIRLAHLSETQRRALVLADNKLAMNAGWDDALLAEELRELHAADFDLDLIGFSEEELEGLLVEVEELPPGDEDDIPSAAPEPKVARGEVYILGRHRMMCGDSTSAEDTKKLFGAASPFLMVTDPPYGVEYDPSWREEAAKKGLIGFAPSSLGKVTNDDRVDWRDAYSLFPGDVAYVWHAGKFTGELAKNLEDCDFEIRSQIIWRKASFAISRGHYHWQHEPCWYAVRKGSTSKWKGDRSQATVWDISGRRAEEDDQTNHGTQKPLECMARPIRHHGDPEDSIYDPFLGSGTTLIAAEKLKRQCFGMELDPIYCGVILDRWEKFTGKQAHREDGVAWSEIRGQS